MGGGGNLEGIGAGLADIISLKKSLFYITRFYQLVLIEDYFFSKQRFHHNLLSP